MNLPAQTLPQPDPALAEMVAQLQAQLAERDQQLARKDQALALAEVKIKVLEERLRLDRIARYGKRSETQNKAASKPRRKHIPAGRNCPAIWSASKRSSPARPSCRCGAS